MNADQERQERRRLKAADRQLKDKRRAEEAKRTERLAPDAMPTTPKASYKGESRTGVMITRLANLIGGIGALSITYGLSQLGSSSTSVSYVLLLFLAWLASGFLGIGLVVRGIFAGKSAASYSWQNPTFLAGVAGILFLVLIAKVMFGSSEEEPSTSPSSTLVEAERHQRKMEELDRNIARLREINRQMDQDRMNAEAQRLSDDLRSRGVGISPAEARALLQTEKELMNE